MTETDELDRDRARAVAEAYPTWEARYRTLENERFQDEEMDHLARMIGAHAGTTVLDVGCGAGANAVRLARRGVRVQAFDYADSVLGLARENARQEGVQDLITFERQDLRALDVPDASVDRVLCWGVLMHIPEVERAIAELSRVLAPGGRLVVCEGNVRSLDEVGLRALDLLGRTTTSVRVPAGRERWRDTPAGPLLARRADIGWLVAAFAREGLTLRARLPHQFTEAFVYMRSGSLLSRLTHGLNRLWFYVARDPRPASTNFLVLEKAAADSPGG
ncbi:MAG: class I SAM-dependent methyltransferase [Solirubrobacteraceae bacterium]